MKVSATKGRTLADLRSVHDKDIVIPNKIRAVIAAMAKEGPEHHVYEQELIKLADISVGDLAKYRGDFEDHIFVVTTANGKALPSPKNIWFHDVKVVKKLRGE
jgi:hypothetical protein